MSASVIQSRVNSWHLQQHCFQSDDSLCIAAASAFQWSSSIGYLLLMSHSG